MTNTDLAAERSVLSGLMQYGKQIYYDIAEIVQPDTFSDLSNQAIYACLQKFFEDHADADRVDAIALASVANEMKLDWLFEKKDEISHIRSLLNCAVEPKNVQICATRIRKLHIVRLLRQRISQLDKDLVKITCGESVDQIIGMAEGTLFDFATNITNTQYNKTKFGDNITEYVDNIIANPMQMVGIGTGFHRYDTIIGGGCRRQKVNLIGARTKVGKSMFALNVALNVALKSIPVLYVDTEMVQEDHMPRMLASIIYRRGGNVGTTDIEIGKFTKNQDALRQVKEAQQIVQNLPIHHVNVTGATIEETLSIMRRILHTMDAKECLILYDYMRLKNSDGLNSSVQEYQALGFLILSLHEFAVKYDVPILAFAQLNRENDIAMSDRMTWTSVSFSILKEKSDEELANDGAGAGNAKMVVLNTRHGPGMSMGRYININRAGKYGYVEEIQPDQGFDCGQVNINLRDL